MNVAITVWENRISPVFDSGRTILIAEIKDNALVSNSYLTFDFDRPLELQRMLRTENVSTIICGAISEGHANMLVTAGFDLISFIAGDVRQVLEAFIKGDPLHEDFKMPGCGKNICCRGRIRHGYEISMIKENGYRGKGRQQQSPQAFLESDDDTKSSEISTDISARLSGKGRGKRDEKRG